MYKIGDKFKYKGKILTIVGKQTTYSEDFLQEVFYLKYNIHDINEKSIVTNERVLRLLTKISTKEKLSIKKVFTSDRV